MNENSFQDREMKVGELVELIRLEDLVILWEIWEDRIIGKDLIELVRVGKNWENWQDLVKLTRIDELIKLFIIGRISRNDQNWLELQNCFQLLELV